jgi:carbamoyl-phosphate synthase small subunit
MARTRKEHLLRLKAILVLEDGSVWPGEGFGAFAKVSGEVVFNTGMVGYPESITDPSYHGQILCQTYPLIGNYGVSPKSFESDKPRIWGYAVSEQCDHPSHATSEKTLADWLKENGIPGISGIDTSALTKKLRIHGVMLGILETYYSKVDLASLRREAKLIQDPSKRHLVSEVTTKKEKIYNKEAPGPLEMTTPAGTCSAMRPAEVDAGTRTTRTPRRTRQLMMLSLAPQSIRTTVRAASLL